MMTEHNSLQRRGLIAALAGAPAVAFAQSTPVQTSGSPQAPETTLFLNGDEVRALTALVDRLIPRDELGPGAVEAGVVVFIDRQLAGAWGAGAHFYRRGPFAAGTPQQGYQLSMVPAELFRHCLAGLDRNTVDTRGGSRFADLGVPEQVSILQDLEAGRLTLDGVPGNVFFAELLAATFEGFFSDPLYGGNRDMAGWRLVGFPGAYASYADQVERHGVSWTRPPISIADNDRIEHRGHGTPAPGPTR